ncbi:MAG: patatin-like phospholipase family protein [Erysipelotrichaceae bacterium]
MKQTALILEGGGMRGMFTAGVLDYFMEQGLYFPATIGVSAGACHAASYVSKQKGRSFHVSTKYLHDPRYCSLRSLLTTGDLFGAKMVYETIPLELEPIDHLAFIQHGHALYTMVTNIKTGAGELKQVKDLLADVEMIRASASLPLLSRSVLLDGERYLDGGISEAIPFAQAKQLGYMKQVVVLTQTRGYQKKKNELQPILNLRYWRFPNLCKMMANRHIRYNQNLEALETAQARGEVFVLAPPTSITLGRLEKNEEKLRKVYQMGYEEAKAQFSNLCSFLGNETQS